MSARPSRTSTTARRASSTGALFQQLATGRWIEERRNLLITGPCGVGKTWLACALGQKACRDNRTVVYKRLPRLFAELELAHGDGRFPRLFRSLVKADLLILDDWGPDRLNRRPAPRPDGDRRGPQRRRLDPRHQPAARSTPGTRSSTSRPSPTPSSTAWSTTPAASTSTAPPCASSRPATNLRRPGHDRPAQPRRPPPCINRSLPRAPPRQPRNRHAAPRAGPSH